MDLGFYLIVYYISVKILVCCLFVNENGKKELLCMMYLGVIVFVNILLMCVFFEDGIYWLVVVVW